MNEKSMISLKRSSRALIIVGLATALTGCGLKGDLYFPEPQTEAETDAVEAENSELESKRQSEGISN
jgi:predicted small lipoprotein YifL